MTKRVRTVCKECGKEFYCNALLECEGDVEYAQDNNEVFKCYCEKCTKKLHLDTVTEIRKCYGNLLKEKERVEFT